MSEHPNFHIFCESDLMHDVQIMEVYKDSKTFVDKQLLYPENVIIEKYADFKSSQPDVHKDRAELTRFVDENFTHCEELEEWTPEDFNSNPPNFVDKILDADYKEWAVILKKIWESLARKVKDDVKLYPDRYSLIWVPNGFCIPGGRFRELYYWDTYWIVNGLLLSDMVQTARGMIENIISLVKQFGFMPNGNRVYYLKRSQPPMLILMVAKYYKHTKDFGFIESNIEHLKTEFKWWRTNRMVLVKKDTQFHQMFRYYDNSSLPGPRPESYKEDYKLATNLPAADRDEFYRNIKAGAETGWDFSSRWFIKNGKNKKTLVDIKASKIIPVDLNSILHKNAVYLSVWYGQLQKKEKETWYKKFADKLLTGLQEVCWRDDLGAWFDWDLINDKHREYFYVSNLTPLWTMSYNMGKKYISKKVLQYLKTNKIIEEDYSVPFYGVPASLENKSKSIEQWDYPNAWPPLQTFLIQGLHRTKDPKAKDVAFNLARMWLHSNYAGFVESGKMHEKYNSEVAGESGKGGEYEVESGFGWTNGVVLEILKKYGRKPELRNCKN